MTTGYKSSQALTRIAESMKAFPIGFRGNPLNLLLIGEEVELIFNASEYFRQLDSLDLGQTGNEVYVGEAEHWPFPVLEMPGRPPAPLVSEALFHRFEFVSKALQRQSTLSNWIVNQALLREADILLLMIVDGLSYYDVEDDSNISPVLVDGPTITQFGYRNAVGRPHISRISFQAGFKQQRAFTYFTTDGDDLSADLHETFGASQVVVVTEHQQIIDNLTSSEISRGYVQIVAPGLDHLCHNHRDRPPKDDYVRNIILNFHRTVDTLGQTGKRVLGYLTADHGILWRDDLPNTSKAVDLSFEDSHHPRYVQGTYKRDFTFIIDSFLGNYSLLKHPYVTRNLRRTEWGVHGGLSPWESIVPLLTIKRNF